MGVFNCPLDVTSWNLASQRLQCVVPNYYHCLLNENDHATEQCLSRVWIQKDMCPEYNSKAGRIDATACISDGCPNKTFWSNKVYEFSLCLDRTGMTSTVSFQSTATTEADLQGSTTLTIIIAAVVFIVLLITIILAVICIVLKRRKHEDNNKKTEEGTPLDETDEILSGNKDENQKISNFGEKQHAVTARTQDNVGRRNDGEGTQLINDTEGRENYTDIDFGISRVWVIVSNAKSFKSATKIQTISQRYSNENLAYINDIQGSWRTGLSQKKVVIFRSGYFSTLEHIKKDFDELYDHLQTQTKLCLVFDIDEDKWRCLGNDIKLIHIAKTIYIP